jgi:hypothetical protein
MPVIEGFAERSAGGAGGAIEGFQPRIISDRQRPTGSPSVLGFANDTIVTGVNSALGIGKAVSDFVSVDNPVSRGIQWLIDEGEETYTPQTRQAREDLFRAIDAGGTDAARGVGEFLLTSPVQAAAMAAGNFGPFGAFIKGARGIAALRGASAAGQRRAGIAAASGMGGAAAGGDAAGDAYEQVMRSPNVDPAVKEQLARQAAREASVVPAIIGAATPFLPGSAESQLARGLGLTRASIPRAAASEFGQEFIEEGATKLSANLAARQYDETIDPSRGVFGSALLGGALGAGTGAGVTFLNNRAVEADLLRRDEALQAAERARQAAERAPYSELPANFFDRIDTDNEVGLGIVRPINPYDAAGYVSAFQEGQDTELGSPQVGLFGNAGGLEQEVEVLAPPAPPAPAAPASKVFSADETELIEMRVNPTPAVRTLWAEAKAAGLSPNELDTIGSELAKSYGQGRKAYKAILLARNAPAASAAPAAPSLVPPNLSLPTAEQIAADQKANPQDWGPSLNVKAPASVAQAPGVTSLPVEPATAPATVARPGTYAVSDAISADGPVEETIRLIVRPDGTSAILRNDGSLIDVTNMVRAGFTAEQAIAQSLGDDTSGANVKSVQAEAPAEAAVPAAPTQGTTDPAASEPVVQRKRRVVNPAALAQSQAFVAPEPIAEEGPTTDPDDDSLEIARLTGQGDLAGALASEMEGTRADKDEISDDAFDSILAERFKDSKDPKRDRAIFNAYLTQMRVAPQGSKALVAESIAQQFGIKPVAVRKVGNPQEVARVAESMGFSAEDVLSRMGVTSRPPSKDAKSQETDSERAALNAALEAAQKRAEAAKADPARKQLRDAMAAIDAGIESAPAAQQATLRAQRSELQRQLQALADEQFKAEDEVASIKQSIDDIEQSRSAAADTALTQGMRDVGVETVEGDTLGYGFDDSREWQKSSSSGNREADVLLRVQQRIEGLRRTIAQLEEQGQTEAVEELRARLDEETQKLDKQLAKHAKPAAPTRALSDELKAAKEKFKAAKFDVAKMEPEELQLLRGEAERFKNKALIDKIDARLREVGAEATAPVSEVSRPPNYAEYSQEELQKLLEDAPQINLNLDVQAIKKYLGEEAAAAYAGMSPRMRDKWWGENATEEMDRESSSSNGIDEETVTEFLKSHSNFSTESARELGRSVGVIARKADDPGFNSSPEFVTLKNAFAYAARMGWSPEEVLAGMRERANEWAKDDAAALFKRLFKPTADKSSTPAALAPAQEPKVRVVKKAQAATPKTEAAAPAPAAPAEVLTTTEQAAKAWDQAANTIPGAPKWAELPAATQNEFKGYGENNWTRRDVVALMQRSSAPGRTTAPDARKPGTGLLDSTKYVYHAVRSDADIASIMQNGLRPGSNVSLGTDGQAFSGEGDTILVFQRSDVAPRTKEYQGDGLTSKAAKPVAILKDTSVEAGRETQENLEEEAVQAQEEFDKLVEYAQREYDLSQKDVEAYAWGVKKIAEAPAEAQPLLKRLRALSRRVESLLEESERAPTTEVSEESVPSRYTQYGVPVQQVVIEAQDDGQTVSLGTRPLGPDDRASQNSTSQRERDLRAKSRDKEQPGDVMLATTGKFVSMEDALEAARAAVESGALRPDAPFQYNAVLDIAPRDWNRMVQAMKGGGPKFSKAAGAGGTVDGVYAALAKFFYRSPESFTSVFGRHVRVHQTEAQAVAAVKGAISAQEMERAQGFVDPRDDRVVHLIADNIRPGTELAVLLHEVGVHVGLLRQLGANFELLAQQVRSWGALPERTLERRVHDAAMARVVLGRLDGSISEDVASEELVAYAAEEAVLAGVQPSPEASNRLSEWLHRLQKLVESAFKSLFGRKVAMKALTAQNLVDFAKGAAEQHLEMTLFEQGALPSAKPTDVLRYYAKSEPDQEVNDDAKVEDFDTDKPGEEGIYWGADSRFGPHTSISTFAETFVDPGEQPHEKGFNEISVYLLSGESRGLYASTGNLDDAILQTVSLRYDAGSDLWSLAVFGPEFDSDLFDKLEVLGQATKLHQDQQFVWTRLEGVPLSDTLEMLAEARRRLTRALGGEVPAIYWNRATGAKPGKTGVYLPEDVVRRFSTRPAERTGFGSEEQENPDVNSRGRKIHHTAEGIRNFWRWFAGSKVVDKDGKPMVMYHGTGESFEEFRQDAPAAHLKLPGLFFTQDPATAEIYTQNVDRQFKGRNIIPVYLRMTNPKKINARDFTGKQAREALLRAREEGHDGAILYGIGVTRFPEYVVFDSTQVKSAIGNTGAFSSSDPRMRFSKRSTQRLPAELQKPVGVITNTLRDVGNAALNTLTFTEDVINRAVDLGIKGAGRLRSIYQERAALTGKLEREVERVADLYNRVPESERGTGPRSVNQFLYDATREGKWGFKPDWRKGPSAAVTLDPEMLRRYGALSKESKELVRSIFRHGDEVLSLKKQTVIDSTNSEYDALIAAASKAGDKNKVARLTADKAEQLKRFSSLFELQEFRPYAPLRRFGNYVVIARSQKYLDADEKQKRQLEKSEDHYHVSFAESAAAARELVEQLQKQGAFAEVVFRQKEAVQQTMFGGTLSAFNKLRSELDSELADAAPGEKAALRAARKVVGELYLSTLAENSARKSEMRRRGVAGEIDVLRSFTTQGRADAQFIAGAKYNGQTLDVFNAMRREVKSGDAEAQNTKSGVFNELMKRHTQSMDYDPTPIASKLARLTSIWFLATSPAYYLQNLTQPFMLSLPFMAGRHNYLKATNALLKAYTDLAPMFRTAKLGEQFNFDAAPQDVRAAISTLVDRGRIDIGMDTDLGRFQIEGQGQFKDRWNKIDRGIYRAAQKLEAVNRLSTAIAAYRMELAKGGDPAKALEYADNVISQTHGDYTANNAPRAFNTPTGKVALQFRKFQLIQLTLLAKLVSNSFPGKKDAAVARQTLAFTLGHTAVMAGAIGLPGFAAISWLLGALGFGDDEEPFNAEKELREFIGNDQLATLITRGVPAALGVDLSNKLGMGNVLSILPFNELDLSSRSGLESAAFSAFGGPAGALTLRAADGINLIRDGQYYKGLEQLMPTGVTNAMRAYRTGKEGVTRRNGDVLISPEEISGMDSFWQYIGFQPTKLAERQFFDRVVRDTDRAFQSRADKIRSAYLRAGDDYEAKAEARDRWAELQDAREAAGYRRQPLSALLRAEQSQDERERNTLGGVQFNRNNRSFVQELIEAEE